MGMCFGRYVGSFRYLDLRACVFGDGIGREMGGSRLILADLQLSGTRRIGISKFKGKRIVNIREYYEKDGEMLPGKKVRSFF